MATAAAAGAAATAPAGRVVPEQFAATVALLDEMYEYQTRTFAKDKAAKDAVLLSKQAAVLASLEAVGADTLGSEKALAAYIEGKALNVLEAYNPAAEGPLSRSVKLDPKNTDAWSALGECFWKKGDVPAARNCFQCGVEQGVSPACLRNLSMALRKLPGDAATTRANIQASVVKAKEAVAANVRDGESWYVLGNAYLASFFGTFHDPADLQKSLAAYSKAIANGSGGNPDLHYNRAAVLKYLEEYDIALEGFRTALAIDPTLPALDTAESLGTHVARIADNVARKGRLKPKRVTALVKALPSLDDQARLESLPASEGRRFVTVRELVASGGSIGGPSMILLKVAMPVLKATNPPVCLIVIDSNEDCVALSLYHLNDEACAKFSERDTLIVMDPVLKEIKFPHEGKEVGYRCLQVFHPDKFIVNGKSMVSSYRHAGLAVTTF